MKGVINLKKSIIIVIIVAIVILLVVGSYFLIFNSSPKTTLQNNLTVSDNKSNNNSNNDIQDNNENETLIIKEEPEDRDNITIYKEYNSSYDFSKILDDISSETSLSKENEIESSKAKELYNLNEFNDVKVTLRNKEAEEGFLEVAIIELSNSTEAIKVLKNIGTRLDKVGLDSSKQEGYILEQNGGIISMVIGKDARMITNLIKEKMKI